MTEALTVCVNYIASEHHDAKLSLKLLKLLNLRRRYPLLWISNMHCCSQKPAKRILLLS